MTALVFTLGAASLQAAAPSSAVTAAVANPARPEADRARDADRKPAEVIAFAGIGPGAKVSEISPGGGYFTRLFSKTVGEKGVVYALVPPRPANAPAPAAGATPPPSPMQTLASDPNYSNVKVIPMDFAAPQPGARRFRVDLTELPRPAQSSQCGSHATEQDGRSMH